MDSLNKQNILNDKVETILDNLIEGCQLISPQFRYVYVNKAVAKQGKSSVEALMGKTMMEAYPGIENTQVFASVKKCMDEGTPQYIENEFTFNDGKKSWFELRMERVPEGVLILSIDITERKLKEDRFKILISNLNEMVHIVDPSGKTKYVTPSVYKIVGYTPEEFMTKNGNDYIHPEDFAKAMESLKKVMDNPGVTTGPFEFRVRHKDGTYKLIEATGINLFNVPEIGGVVVTSRDISERRSTEEEMKARNVELENNKAAMLNLLEDSRDLEEQLKIEKENVEKKVFERTKELNSEKIKLSASISSLTLGFIMTDRNNNIVTINQSARYLLCASKSSPLTTENCSLVHIEDELKGAIDLRSLITQSMNLRKSLLVKELSFEDRFLKIIITPITELADVLGCVVLIDDITEAKILERSKDEFFSIASHELRTPLTAIRGNVSLIKEYYSDKITDKELRDMIDDVGESSVRLIKIVNDFLNMSRLEMGKMEFKKEQINLIDLVSDVIKEYETTGSLKMLDLGFTPPKAPVSNVLGDKDKARQIVVNLIGNSIKYTEKGGINVFLEENDGFVKVLVKDTGKGISPENQKLLFHKFQQAGSSIYTRDSSQSTGLGLYISKRMAEGMDGRVALENSAAGVGSTFSFKLPIFTQVQETQVPNIQNGVTHA